MEEHGNSSYLVTPLNASINKLLRRQFTGSYALQCNIYLRHCLANGEGIVMLSICVCVHRAANACRISTRYVM